MAKKRSWFNLVKRFFISDAETKPEKKEKRRKWVFFGKFKIKRRLPSIAAPPASPPKEAITAAESLHKEGQSKSALDVALASAAAAEAAIAAAHLAAEVVWLSTGVSQSNHQCQKETEQLHQGSTVEDQAAKITHSDQDDMIKIQELAAVKIQTAFRAYLAKKALRALKGIVKLQAIIRGRNVRRQAINTLKCLQSIVNIQSQVQARRIRVAGDENWQLQNLRDKIIKMDANSPKRWDGSILTKEESEAVYLSKKEAAIKRERIKEYAFSHRNSAETDRSKMNGRFKYWLEQWVDNQVAKSKELEDLDTVVTSNPKPRVEYKGKPLKLKTLPKQYHIEGLDSPTAAPRRSFHGKQPSLGEDNNSPFSGSPVVPTYMATTESTKAKARSMSSPKLRPGSFDAYSDSYSPCKNRLPLMTSTTSTQIASNVRVTRASVYQQRSPSFKGVPSPVKSCRTLKDLSIDSECSFRTWDPHSTFR